MYSLGYNGRAVVHGFDLAHGNHLCRSLLFASLPSSLPTNEVSDLRRGKDRLRLDRVHRNLLLSVRFRTRQSNQHLPRWTLRPRSGGLHHLRVDLCVLRSAGGDVRDLRQDAAVSYVEKINPVDLAPEATTARRGRSPPGSEIDDPHQNGEFLQQRGPQSNDVWNSRVTQCIMWRVSFVADVSYFKQLP